MVNQLGKFTVTAVTTGSDLTFGPAFNFAVTIDGRHLPDHRHRIKSGITAVYKRLTGVKSGFINSGI